MTIFLEIVKKFLEAEITKVRDSSVEADAGLCNYFASTIGYGRDAELSGEKRGLAIKLLIDLANIKDKDKDVTSCEALKVLIDGFKLKAKEASEKKDYNEGTFGPAMLAACTLTDDIYKKLGSVKLLDIQHDDDPFNELRFQMANYFSQKVFDARSVSIINSLKSNPKVSSSNQVAKEKEALIIRSLLECQKDLQTLDIEHVDYAITRRKRVLQWIKTMREENIGVCKEHTSVVKIPLVSFSIFGKADANIPTLGPDEGFLEEYLKQADEKIRKDLSKDLLVESKETLAF